MASIKLPNCWNCRGGTHAEMTVEPVYTVRQGDEGNCPRGLASKPAGRHGVGDEGLLKAKSSPSFRHIRGKGCPFELLFSIALESR
jgi:hypothetical protein